MNDKQKKFAEEYVLDYNATKAAIRAGYSERTAYSQGNRLLKNAEVLKYIEELKEKIRSEKVAQAREVLEYLTSVMRGQEKENTIIVVDGEPMHVTKEVGAKERIRAAEGLGKHYSLFNDGVKLNGEFKVVIVDDIPGEADDE